MYLHKRYDAIIVEMKKRGFKPSSERIFPKNIFKEKGLYNDWILEEDDYKKTY